MLVHCVSLPSPFHAVEQILDPLRDRFIHEVDASFISYDLLHNGIISEGDLRTIQRHDDPSQQNRYLHSILLRKCTSASLMAFCDVLIAVKGAPKMKNLGMDMKTMLDGGRC